jgi:hypothetical protein
MDFRDQAAVGGADVVQRRAVPDAEQAPGLRRRHAPDGARRPASPPPQQYYADEDV